MLDRFVAAWRGLLTRRRAERELDEELQFHVEMETDANVARGKTPTEARRIALRDLGGVDSTRDAVRDQRATWIDPVAADVRCAARALLKAPAFSAAVVATLAIGIGGSTVVFSVVEALLFRPLPYENPDRVVTLTPHALSWADFETIRQENRSLSGTAAYAERGANLLVHGQPVRATIAGVSPNLFDVLGVRPRIGRGFLAQEDRRGGDHVALISDGCWRNLFGSSPAAVGRTFVIDRDVFTVIGVLPADFRLIGELQPGRESAFDPRVQAFVPASPVNRPDNRDVTGNWRGIVVVGRLKDSVALTEARADVERIANRANLPGVYGGPGGDAIFSLKRIRQAVAGDLSSRLTVLSLAVGLLLLAACANVANLLLERLERRRGELALRAALGASAGQLARAGLAEAALLTFGGGLAGCFVAWGGVRLVQVYGSAALANLAAVRVNVAVLAFAAVLSALTALPLGLVLAARLVRLGIGRSLHGQVEERRLGGLVSLRGALVVSQMVVSVVLVVVGALLARDLASLANVDLGFKPDRILATEISLDRVTYVGRSIPFFSELLDRLNTAPGVQRAALAHCAPGWEGICGNMVQVEGGPAVAVEGNTVSDDYFTVMSIPLLAGRALTRDDSLGTLSAVVNEAFALAYWPSVREALGKRLQRPSAFGGEPLPPYEVVGVVGNSREMGSGITFKPRIYGSFRQVFWVPRTATVLIKAQGEPGSLAGTLAAEVRRLDPGQPLSKSLPLERIVSARYARQSLMLVMMVSFAVLTLLLAAVGIHGVIAYAVTLRRREIGVRLAFGATCTSVVRLFVLGAMRLVLVGLVIGLPVAIGLRWIAAVEWVGSAESDWLTTLAGVAVVASTGVLAAFVPAWKAARLDAMDVLRCD